MPWRAQDPAHRRRRHRDAQLADLADDPDVTPSRVLPRQPDHELHHHRIQPTRAAFTGVRICPAAGYQVPVPTQQRRRCHQERRPALPGSSFASHTSTSRSLGAYRGRLTCRCRTASWCRNTAISTSLESVPRLSPTRPTRPRSSNHPTVRTTTAVIFPSRTSTRSGPRPRSGTLHADPPHSHGRREPSLNSPRWSRGTRQLPQARPQLGPALAASSAQPLVRIRGLLPHPGQDRSGQLTRPSDEHPMPTWTAASTGTAQSAHGPFRSKQLALLALTEYMPRTLLGVVAVRHERNKARR